MPPVPPTIVCPTEETLVLYLEGALDERAEANLVAGKYELMDQLGAGGMGRVYRARHVGLRRDVAIKFLRSEFVGDKSVVRRFEREARAAASLRGNHVVQILDIDRLPSGAPF